MQPKTQLAMSPDQAARELSLGRTKLYSLIKSGDLRALKCGRRTIITAKEINRFLKNLENGEATSC